MTVFLNVNSVSELKFNPPGGSRATAIAVPVKKEKLEDFFPRTQRELPGYLCKETFKSKLATIMKRILEGMKSSRIETENLTAQNTQGGYLNPALKPKAENYSKKLNEFHHAEHVRQTNMELKSRIMEGLEQEEWYSFEKLEMADKMYEDSKRYLAEAVSELGSLGVSKGLSAINISKLNPSKLGLNKVNFSKLGLGKVNLPKIIESTHIKGHIGTFKVDFNLVNIISTMGVMAGANNAMETMFGIPSQEAEPPSDNGGEKFKALDCMKAPENLDTVTGKLGLAASLAGKAGRYFFPVLNYIATGVNTLGNAGLAYTNYSTSKRIRAIENENNQKNAEFLSRLKQNICDDFNELQDNEIEALMSLLGINKNEYLSL